VLLILCINISNNAKGAWQSAPNKNLSNFYNESQIDAELYLNGEVINLKNFRIKNPKSKIIILYNHGNNNSFKSQECRPNNFAVTIKKLIGKNINSKKIIAIHLCSYSFNANFDELVKIRAKEIKHSISYITGLGVSARNIFVFGQSSGGWSALYYAAKHQSPELGGYLIFAPAICGPKPLRCQKVISDHITLFKKARIKGIVFSHKRDPYLSFTDHKFVKEIGGLTLRGEFCKTLKGVCAHRFYRNNCSKVLVTEITEFMSKNSTGSHM